MKSRKAIHVAGLIIGAACLIALAGCDANAGAKNLFGGSAGGPLMDRTISVNETGTDSDGFYYSFWKGVSEGGYNGSASMTMDTGTPGNYTATWNNVSNFTCGKGWANGSPSRVVSYSGSFSPSEGGENNGYLALYGWGATSTPAPGNYCVVEYYIIENYGNWTPPGSESLGSFESDGGTYTIHRTLREGQPWAVNNGNGTFYQYWSVRTSKRSSGIITFTNHLQAWADHGLTDIQDVTQYYQIMETEGYHSSGNSDITVSEGASGGGDGFPSLAGRSVSAGSLYLQLGERRDPVVPDDDLLLRGLFVGMNFHNVSGSSVDVELVMVPLDSATEALVRAEKDPPESAYAGMSFSSAAGARACFMAYNASPLAVSAYRGWETMSSDGMTIDLGDFNFTANSTTITVNDFVMTYTHISDDPESGLPHAQISYDYSYSVDGEAMTAEGTIFVSRNPPVILPSIKTLLQENAVPDAMVSGDAYSLVSAWSGKHITVTASGSNAAVKAQPVNEGWTSQDWVAESVSGKERTVRLRNIWTGKYLHAQSNEENAKVVCFDLHADWLSEQWEIEQTGLLEARFRNLWTNRYLTVVDTGDYADIILKQLNTGWASQRWDVDWLVWHQ